MLGKKIITQTHVWREILKKIVGDYGEVTKAELEAQKQKIILNSGLKK